jgi:hypothetical protein
MKKILNGVVGLLVILSGAGSYADGRGEYSYATLPQGTVIHMSGNVLFPADTYADMQVGSCNLTLGDGSSVDHDRILHSTDFTVENYVDHTSYSCGSYGDDCGPKGWEGLKVKDSAGQEFVLSCGWKSMDSRQGNWVIPSIDRVEKDGAGVLNITLPLPQTIGSAEFSQLAELNDSSRLLTSPRFAETQASLNHSKESFVSAAISGKAAQGTESAGLAE